MSDPVVTVEGLTKRYGDLTVLEDVTFAAPPGSVTCVVGPNGSGKSTLLGTIAGVTTPTAGSVTVAADADRPVGYLPQRPSFRPTRTLAETVDFYGELAGEAVAVDERLETVGLQDVPDRRVGALSGGMTRLLGIAQATVGDPPVLALDEPSSGLDPVMVEHVAGVVADLAADGTAVVLATHNVAAVDRMADRVLVLDAGRVVADDDPGGLVASSDADTLVAALADRLGHGEGDISVDVGRREVDR